MKSFELLLTFLFMIIIYMVVVNGIPSEFVVGAASLWFVILWVGFDNLKMCETSITNGVFGLKNSRKCREIKNKIKKEKDKNQDIVKESEKKKEMEQETKKITERIEKANAESKQEIKKVEHPPPKKHTKLVYSENNYKYNIFDDLGCDGDNKLAHKMKHTSNLNREAMDNFSRMQTKYSNIGYFEQELKEHAASRWWDNPELEDEF